MTEAATGSRAKAEDNAKAKVEAVLSLEDSRRLTGPNLFWDHPGAIIEVSYTHIEPAKVAEIWARQARALLDNLGWVEEKITSRAFAGGSSLVISAPIDGLYAATDINEAAWELTANEILGQAASQTRASLINTLRASIKTESNPALLALQAAAEKHQVCFLSDDEEVSIGHGKHCLVFPVGKIPQVNTINWQKVACIPVGMVTGTNGKTTTVRLTSAIMQAAGKCCGMTSTDYIRVGDSIIDRGDYSGPGGARTLLRHPRSEVAILEVARGGLLRRGLSSHQATASLITNVAEDHLGDYGINIIADMVATKFIVRRALQVNQDLILNADDPGCVAYASSLKTQIVWFSTNRNNALIQRHIKAGGAACYVEDGVIYFHRDGKASAITSVTEIPITMGGAARHNVQNALAAVALSTALGADTAAIASGLKNFSSSSGNNPGRGNVYKFNGITAIVDFAHNEHGLSAMAETVSNLPAKRRLILLGQAGDRSDELIHGLVKSALKAKPDALVVCELVDHLRGRKLQEVPKLIQRFAIENGMSQAAVLQANSPLEGVEQALQWAQAGDVLLLLALSQRDEVTQLLASKIDH